MPEVGSSDVPFSVGGGPREAGLATARGRHWCAQVGYRPASLGAVLPGGGLYRATQHGSGAAAGP
jgi:hypothetical protein